ncbi:acyl carrier protein [Paenibacillus allorhizosphaerae]|uniref:D-alanyl carrier protein n=1 Tax=Paenibacillus allorhizosphaerae TaxID=2849866 RepID=A0ABN7TXL8_9BACL|nr:phosphopantetheine-binding protein [Paenibacillus allorhizosphaerae]CAG7659187.1 D-alanyl carrier protein [Paenibacillus allorhizosphaerae]
MPILINLRTEIESKVKELLQVDGNIQLDQDLTSIGLDSMRSVGLIVDLETQYNISFNDDELLTENFSTINKIVERVQSKLT